MSIEINEVLKEVKKLRKSVAISLDAIEYITQQDLEHILGQVTAIENYLEDQFLKYLQSEIHIEKYTGNFITGFTLENIDLSNNENISILCHFNAYP